MTSTKVSITFVEKRNMMKDTAIVVIEFQKSWTDKGFFNWLIKKELSKNDVVKKTSALLKKARKQSVKIIQAPLLIDKNSENYKKMPFPARLFKQLTKGTWKAEFTEGIYEKTDLVAEGRYGFDATKGSNLLGLLHDNKIKTVYVCGFTTDHCVKETMDTLIEKGYKCYLVSDCTAARNSKLQEQIERQFDTVNSYEVMKL